MTAHAPGRAPARVDIRTFGAPADADERHVLLRRAILIRHGETAWTLTGQHTGVTDLPLTENGRNAARELAPLAATARFALVLTSPLHRARETCELAGLGAQAQIDPNLREWNYGAYEGLTSPEIHAQAPGWMLFTDGCPEGEAPGQVAARVDQVIARLREVEADVALFGHGEPVAPRALGVAQRVGTVRRNKNKRE